MPALADGSSDRVGPANCIRLTLVIKRSRGGENDLLCGSHSDIWTMRCRENSFLPLTWHHPTVVETWKVTNPKASPLGAIAPSLCNEICNKHHYVQGHQPDDCHIIILLTQNGEVVFWFLFYLELQTTILKSIFQVPGKYYFWRNKTYQNTPTWLWQNTRLSQSAFQICHPQLPQLGLPPDISSTRISIHFHTISPYISDEKNGVFPLNLRKKHLDVSENSGFSPPNHPWINRVFHYFHHPFWGTPIFGNTHLTITTYWQKWPQKHRSRFFSAFSLPAHACCDSQPPWDPSRGHPSYQQVKC